MLRQPLSGRSIRSELYRPDIGCEKQKWFGSFEYQEAATYSGSDGLISGVAEQARRVKHRVWSPEVSKEPVILVVKWNEICGEANMNCG